MMAYLKHYRVPFSKSRNLSVQSAKFCNWQVVKKFRKAKAKGQGDWKKSEQILHDANFIPNLTKFLYCDVSNSKQTT